MYSQILVLHFSKDIVHKPVCCSLVRKFDLTFNILKAEVFPRKEGLLILELYGDKKNYNKGVKYLKEQGIIVKKAAQEVKRLSDKCTHCGACTAVCPTGALHVSRPDMHVEFDMEKCSACELCITACPT